MDYSLLSELLALEVSSHAFFRDLLLCCFPLTQDQWSDLEAGELYIDLPEGVLKTDEGTIPWHWPWEEGWRCRIQETMCTFYDELDQVMVEFDLPFPAGEIDSEDETNFLWNPLIRPKSLYRILQFRGGGPDKEEVEELFRQGEEAGFLLSSAGDHPGREISFRRLYFPSPLMAPQNWIDREELAPYLVGEDTSIDRRERRFDQLFGDTFGRELFILSETPLTWLEEDHPSFRLLCIPAQDNSFSIHIHRDIKSKLSLHLWAKKPHTRPLKDRNWDRVVETVAGRGFWKSPDLVLPGLQEDRGTYLLEGWKDGVYHCVARHAPDGSDPLVEIVDDFLHLAGRREAAGDLF